MVRYFLVLVIAAACVVVARIVARRVFALPDISGRAVSRAIPADPETALGQLMARAVAQHGGRSGVMPLLTGSDALASRMALAEAAEQSIDTQYYIWHDDISGILLLDALQRAAQRGVRVRLLLDDNGVDGLDSFMAALNAQENFEIRLFNPTTVRSPKMLGYAYDFMRMNRRMHNKSFIADGVAAIIGGRNIGDEYFSVGKDGFYIDTDVLATGPVVGQTAAMFDAYWNCASVFAVGDIIRGAGDAEAFGARVAEVLASPESDLLQSDLENSAERFAEGEVAMEWTGVELVADDPVKGQGMARRDQLMVSRLGAIISEIEESFDLISAYFVPGLRGTRLFTRLARSGKKIRILTNAMDTTDVSLVHVGYSRYRRRLLQSGIKLFELKLRGGMTPEKDLQVHPIGLAGASLHAKTFAIDKSRVFIGSFNFDRRSAMLNCEMGFLINSPAFAEDIAAAFDRRVDFVSYRPELTPEGEMVWHEALGAGQSLTYQEEPGTSWFQQATFVLIGLLPIEWLL